MRIALMAIATTFFLGACGTTPEPEAVAPAQSTAKQAVANLPPEPPRKDEA